MSLKLDRDSFRKVLNVPALRIPKSRCQEYMKKFRGHTLDRPKLRCIVSEEGKDDTRLLLLDEKIWRLSCRN